MCTSGYVRKGTVPEKVALFSTKDKKMQKLWMKYIPRKNYIFTDIVDTENKKTHGL